MADEVKIDSNATSTKMAEETTIGVLPGSPTWYEMEPNSYSDFGAQLALVARNPINSGRQRKKGVITDLDASGGMNQDITYTNLAHLWPSVFFSTKEDKTNYVSDGTGATSPIQSVEVTVNTFTLDGDVTAAVKVGQIYMATGFGDDGNNGMHVVTAVAYTTDTAVTMGGSTLIAETTAPTGATLTLVGFQYVADDAGITNDGTNLPTLTSVAVSTLAHLGLQVGEFIYIGGDGAATDFVGASNNGFARVSSIANIATGIIQLDKTSGGTDGETETVTEVLALGETLQIFFGGVTKNVGTTHANYSRHTWAIERSLGIPNPTGANDYQSEVLEGAVLNEFALNIAQADKITMDATFIATDKTNYADTATKPTESGSDATIESATAYNTSSDFSRIRMAEVRPSNDAAPSPLFAYVTEVAINVNNNVSPNKAVGVLGAFDLSVGTFEVSGSITAYFADVASVDAVRNNADVTLDVAIVKTFGSAGEARKTGMVWDVPLIALGDGRLEVTQDEAITIPLDVQAAEYEVFGHTLMLCEFDYLPDVADT